MEGEQLLDFVIFRNTSMHFGERDVEASAKAEFAVWVGGVIDGTKTIFCADILCRNASLLAQFSAHGGKRVGLTRGIAVAPLLKKASDDVKPSQVNRGFPPSLVEDIAVNRLHHGADSQR